MAGPAWWILALFYFASCPETHSQRITPLQRDQTVKLGDVAHMVCQSGEKLEGCLFDLPNGKSISPRPGAPSYNGVTYYGQGLERGQCGIEIRAVSEEHNGEYTCTLTPSTSVESFKASMRLTVAKAPGLPELSVSRGSTGDGSFKEGETLFATCRVNGGRPAANLSWYIGDEKITDGLSLATTISIPQQGLFNINQNLTRRVQSSDHGKLLKCVAEHPLLQERNSTVRPISVVFPPKPHPDTFEFFGLVEGAEGRVSVSVQANPKPAFTWYVDQDAYYEGDDTPEKPFFVLKSNAQSEKGNGYWESVMVIRTLSKEDTERRYSVTANNAYGEETYRVAVSTNPEPKMLNLGVGTILGIIVAVLLLLTIASVLVFARAKGRWCFAAKRERNPQVTAESSDTESADHHNATSGSKGSGNGKPKMAFKLTFKKPPKPSPEEAAEIAVSTGTTQSDNEVKHDDGDNEENRLNPPTKNADVVYAELDLQNAQGARARLVRPEDEKTEYAEIIHTDQHKKK